MLISLAILFAITWVLGVAGMYDFGSLTHVLLVIALVLTLMRLVSGRWAAEQRRAPLEGGSASR
jgi:hypothetical protein